MTDSIQKELARLQRYDEELTKVIPKDFKDWNQNSKEEYPEIAAWIITNLREQLDWAHKEIERLYEDLELKSVPHSGPVPPMNLTRKQITIVVSSLLCSQKQFYEDSEMYKDIDDLIEMFDLEHQKIMENLK